MNITRILSTLALSTLLSVAALAGPNLSGDWKLNPAKSDFGPMPGPDKLLMKVDHKEPVIKIQSEQSGQQGDVKMEQNYTTDGKECKNKMRNAEMVSKLKWEGNALSVDSKLDFQGNEVSIKETWSLSDEGKVLTIKRKIAAPQGEFETTQVLEKQ